MAKARANIFSFIELSNNELLHQGKYLCLKL